MSKDQAQALWSSKEFYMEYFRRLKNYTTSTEAYESIEVEFKEHFGRRRYASVKSFENACKYRHARG